ncbi:MAG: acyltransferase family protein [Acidimicrobiia bacterium]
MVLLQSPDRRAVASSPRPGRFPALDGLRGIASLIVVAHHVMLCDPQIWLAQIGNTAPAQGTWRWYAMYTPLHALWGGTEAVYVFFVLSGLVLVLPYVSAPTGDWTSYYAKRTVRLYAPVVLATAVAVAWAVVIPRDALDGASGWLTGLGRSGISTDFVVRDLWLLSSPGHFNSVLWSLKWEVVFSALLPLFVVAGRVARLPVALGIVSMAALSALGAFVGHDVLRFMPMFGAGVLVTFAGDRSWFVHRLQRSGVVTQLGLTVVSVCLLVAPWLASGRLERLGRSSNAAIDTTTRFLSVSGAALLVLVVMHGRRPCAVFSGRSLRWLGSRSFSLYLVHEPFVVSMAYLMGPRPNMVVFAAVCVGGSLVLAEAFWRLCERATQRWANAAGRWAARRAQVLARM